MASTGVNVLRYTALGAGVLYGFYHQAKLSAATRMAAVEREYHQKELLIGQAKAAYAKKNAPASSKGDVIRDPNDANFDLEALLKAVQAEGQ